MMHYKWLAAFAAARLSRSCQKQKKRAVRFLSQLRPYAERCPRNYRNKVCLIEAELASSSGNYQDAFAKYNLAIELAREQTMNHEQGIACEGAGYAMRECDRWEEVREYFRQAKSCFEQWGASAKVNQMEAILNEPQKETQTHEATRN